MKVRLLDNSTSTNETRCPSGRDVSSSMAESFRSVRQAQVAWAETPVRARLQVIRRFRFALAANATGLAETVAAARKRPTAEILASEVLPLAEAAKFLEEDAQRLLAPKKLGSGHRPFWLTGVTSTIRREPLGVVLVIGPSNYPLFLPGVQVLQALVAGNAVILKPGRGGLGSATAMAEMLVRSGLDANLLTVLPDTVEASQRAIANHPDKVFLTGSAESGAEVLAQLAPELIPATVELSGCDAAFVRDDADLDLAVDALLFGLQLNQAATCIAPRRVFVTQARVEEFKQRLVQALRGISHWKMSLPLSQRLQPFIADALSRNAHLMAGQQTPSGQFTAPLVLTDVKPGAQILQEDVFAPVLALLTVRDDCHALELAAQCPYALGACVFSKEQAGAQRMARNIQAGMVTINDLIVPAADPRVPFGGRKRSGFGVTRGAEGLLEMTVPKVVMLRKGRWRPHFAAPGPEASDFFCAYLSMAHGGSLQAKFAAAVQMLRVALRSITKKTS